MRTKWKDINTPNKLTLLRILLLLPLLLICSLYVAIQQFHFHTFWFSSVLARVFLALILVIFAGAMITDYFDGKIARKTNNVTSFGKLWDPIADKLVTTTILLFLSVVSKGYVSFIVLALFVCRDLIVDGCRVAMKEFKLDVSSSIWGKIKTFILTFAIAWVLILMIAFPSFDSLVLAFYRIDTDAKRYGFWLAINIPLIAALVFSLISGSLYVIKVSKYISYKSHAQFSEQTKTMVYELEQNNKSKKTKNQKSNKK
ncbi:CDP-diacylglycerol--glycerol-3-phosphate 3-phosphatidyltransferase [Mycoplasmopsis mucosicanis]|uniref:CDP-diacylglycerol--glycerol-3-phosphate 3-phosphatidyltransferase n=1 Tax=Mycoplasmopsis mucosicanis TaxID=458208 RepID=UPI001F265634|nr:CDP-diacylglycerol--glycerol-3-phosphate 3-phosphatidyltransferase [Mycoplasmopsis mucosicanis]